jgi:hypothetical protein
MSQTESTPKHFFRKNALVKGKGKGHFVGVYSTLRPEVSSFIHHWRRHIPNRHEHCLLAKEGTICNFASKFTISERARFFYMPQCWDMGQIILLRSGANPRSWVPEASMLTARPPKPLWECVNNWASQMAQMAVHNYRTVNCHLQIPRISICISCQLINQNGLECTAHGAYFARWLTMFRHKHISSQEICHCSKIQILHFVGFP